MTNETENLVKKFNPLEEELTFWIEGILTPGISTAGIIGKAIKKIHKTTIKRRWPFDKFKESLD